MSGQEYDRGVCAGFVTFNPDVQLFSSCMDALQRQVAKMYVYDNGSRNNQEVRRICEQYGAELYGSSANEGISKALNELCHHALVDGYHWMLTMDQDSLSDRWMVSSLVQYVGEDVGIVAPRIEFWSKGILVTSTKRCCHDVDEITACITSGSLTNLSAWNHVGGFDEWMFIDHVDNDFCIRLRLAGYRILRVHAGVLSQRAGEMGYMSLPFGKKILLPHYSDSRHYYSCRNTVYYLRKYRSHIRFIHELGVFVYSIVIRLLFEQNRFQTMRSTVKAVSAGLRKEI